MSLTHVLTGADVRTMDGAGARVDAIAWRDGLIVAAGPRAQVERDAADGGELRITDVGGATVLPGFIDAHQHPSLLALWSGQVHLRPPRVTDIPSLQQALADAAARLPEGQWLVAIEWDELLLKERRPPTRAELDEAVPDRPLMAMHYTCHRALANSRGLERAGIGRNTPDPSGGVISRGRGGLPDGLLIERAMCRVEALARASLIAADAEGYLARLAAHHRALAAAGITRVVDATVPGDLITLYREQARRGDMLVPTIVLPVSTAGYLEMPWDVLDGSPDTTGTGDEDGPLIIGPVKLVFDGAPGCAMCLNWWQVLGSFFRTAALAIRLRSLDPVRAALSLEPRLSRDLKFRTGIAMYSPDDAVTIIRAAADRGFAVATHAIGNEAITTAVTAYEQVGSALGRAGVPRIEHAAFMGEDVVTRIADVGAAAVVQPHLVGLPAIASAAEIPGMRYIPLRWMLDAGVRLAGSSDYPVSGFDPLDGVRGAVTRRSARGGGHVYEPDQCVTLDEALLMYTRNAAEVCNSLDRCGTLEPGKRADLVVIDRRLDEGSLDEARVRATVIGGELVHGAPAPA